MHENRENIKAEPSNIGKLFAAFLELTGTTDSKEISARIGVPIRTVQRWLKDARIGVCAKNADARIGAETPELAPASCARIENPSGLNNTNKLASCARAEKILDWVLKEFSLAPDQAEKFIAHLQTEHGIAKLESAQADFITRQASGTLKHHNPMTWVRFVEVAKPREGQPEEKTASAADVAYLKLMEEFEREAANA